MEMDENDLKDFLQEAQTLKVISDDLLTSVFSWINFDIQKRKHYFDEIIHLINIKSCSTEVIQHLEDQNAEIVDENNRFYSAKSHILYAKISPVEDDVNTVHSLIVVDSYDGKCWKLSEDPMVSDSTEFTRIPDCPLQRRHRPMSV